MHFHQATVILEDGTSRAMSPVVFAETYRQLWQYVLDCIVMYGADCERRGTCPKKPRIRVVD